MYTLIYAITPVVCNMKLDKARLIVIHATPLGMMCLDIDSFKLYAKYPK